MTWILFIVCFCYFLFVLPRVVYTIFFGSIYTSGFQAKKNPWIDLSLYISYWSHYAINFFIYVVRIKKFRNAYFYLFKKVFIISTFYTLEVIFFTFLDKVGNQIFIWKPVMKSIGINVHRFLETFILYNKEA